MSSFAQATITDSSSIDPEIEIASGQPCPEDCMCDSCLDSARPTIPLIEVADLPTQTFLSPPNRIDSEERNGQPRSEPRTFDECADHHSANTVDYGKEPLDDILSAEEYEIQDALIASAARKRNKTCTLRDLRRNKSAARKINRARRQSEASPTPPGTKLDSDSRFHQDGKDGKRFGRLTERTQQRESASPRYFNARRAA